MKRVRRHTERWAPRLGLAVAVSAAVHLVPLLVARRLARTAPLDIEMHVDAVEIGLEQARPGEHTPPATPPVAPPTPQPEPPVAPPTPPSTEHPHTSASHRASPPVTHDTLPPLPESETQLREPTMQLAHPTPHLVPPEEQQLEQHHDEVVPPVPTTQPANTALPSIASAMGSAAAMVPRGALFTLLIRSDRVRMDPNANAVRNLLGGIPDWNAMLGDTQLDPIADLDEIVLAAANPFGADGHAPDWFVLAKGAHGSDAAMRRAVESMLPNENAGAHRPGSSLAPSPVNPPDLDGGMPPQAAAATDAGRPSPWRSVRDGIEQIDVERYGTRRSFVMLGDGTAAIALPGQVEALLGAWSRRGAGMVSRGDPRLSMLIEAEGVRNTISFNTWRGPFPMPTRAALGVYQRRDGATPTGAVDLRSEWQYDDRAQAEHAREMFEYSRGRWHIMINERLGQQGGLSRLLAGVAASVVGIDLGALESAIDALHFRIEGNRLIVTAGLDQRQVRALLNAAAMGGGGQ